MSTAPAAALQARMLGPLEYLHAGSGAPVALAHGAGGDVVLNFGSVISALGSERALVGLRYPGTGGSEAGGDLDVAALADGLVAAMDAQGHERFPVLGASFGCAVALAAALRHPQRVTALVLTVGFAEADLQLRTVVRVWSALRTASDRAALGAFLLTHLCSPNTLETFDAGSFDRAALDTANSLPEGAFAQMSSAVDVDLDAALGGIHVPTLVVVAGRDRVVAPATTRRLAQRIPGARMIEYPDAGHAFTADEGARWAADIRAFLSAAGV